MSESYLTMDTDLLKQDINTFHIQMETFCQEMEAMRGRSIKLLLCGKNLQAKALSHRWQRTISGWQRSAGK